MSLTEISLLFHLTSPRHEFGLAEAHVTEEIITRKESDVSAIQRQVEQEGMTIVADLSARQALVVIYAGLHGFDEATKYSQTIRQQSPNATIGPLAGFIFCG